MDISILVHFELALGSIFKIVRESKTGRGLLVLVVVHKLSAEAPGRRDLVIEHKAPEPHPEISS